MGCRPPGPSVHGVFQARILEGVAISFSSGFSWLRNQTPVSYVSCIGRGFYITEPSGKPIFTILRCYFLTYKLKFFLFSSTHVLSSVRLFVTPWTATHHASLSIISSQSLLKLMSIESMMPSKHLIFCHPLLLPSIFPSMRVFSNEWVLHIRWPKYWSFSFHISPSNEFRVDFLWDELV